MVFCYGFMCVYAAEDIEIPMKRVFSDFDNRSLTAVLTEGQTWSRRPR